MSEQEEMKLGKWSETETDYLIDNWKNQKYEEIAEKLNRPFSSIEYKSLQLGFRKKNLPWNRGELNILKELYSTASKQEIMELIPNRTWDTIYQYARKLDLSRGIYIPPLDRLPNLNLSETEKSWFACAVDCEGTFGIHKATRTGCYTPYISINNTDIRLLQYFKNITKTHSKIRLQYRTDGIRKNIYEMRVADMPRIYELIKNTYSYLIIKQLQAQILVELIELKDRIMRKGDGIYDHPQAYEDMFLKIKGLNKRGI